MARLSASEICRLPEMFAAGYNDCQIARRIGVCPAAIQRRRHKMGFAPYPTGGAMPRDHGVKLGEWMANRLTLSTQVKPVLLQLATD